MALCNQSFTTYRINVHYVEIGQNGKFHFFSIFSKNYFSFSTPKIFMKSSLFWGILKFYILENKCVGEALISPFLLILTHFCHIGPSSCWLIFWATMIFCTSKEPIFHENLGYTEWQKKFIVKNLKKLKFIILIYFSIVHIDAIYSKTLIAKCHT